MFSIAHDKIRPIVSISIDQSEQEWNIDAENMKESFLFLKREDQLSAYVHVKELLSRSERLTTKMLLSNAVSLDTICHLSKNISLTALFQIIGAPIAIVKNERGELTGYIRREDVFAELFKQENKSVDLLKIILTSIPMGIFVVDREKKIVNCNESGLKMIKSTPEKVMNAPAEQIFNGEHINNVFATGKTILNQLQITNEMGVLVDYSPIPSFDQRIEGMVIIVQDLPMVEDMAMEIEYIKDLNKDLHAILSSIYDEILVVNHKGELIRYSETVINDFWGRDLKDLLGKNLLDLEKKGLFSPSVTRLVLEQQKKVSIVQETKKGRKILAVGNPVFNENGELHRIIIASRDITEATRLKTELHEIKKISEQYKKELDSFKNKDRFLKKLIYCSPKMEQIITQAKKIADFSSNVLISGESGVGKEVIAQAIHQLGNRSSNPFLKLNCGAIPETLLESELFGYTKGAFTGADKNGKEGYFKRADQGILFLDEIGEMPLHLQVKLLRVLQEQEVIPIGSTIPTKINVQIIAATNKRLEKMVEAGTFREDLFYRLNVIPLQVPPLRERMEDVPLLAFHFLQELNEKYNKNYHLTPDALNLLEFYSWPGNVRELQNMIERLVVSADDSVIDAEFVSKFLNPGYDFKKSKPVITRVLPLQEALHSVEEQLILLAMKQYKTTTKAAKALGISQSSVSRKYQKIMNEKEIAIDTISYF
ncbi:MULTISPECIES: sigma 54-interacting transcriptional regulator [Bacillus]|uniref:sigma 54-interacting transcriptional regulator n=1 Tax=Bacillus TaxID=1386 RepID=UPI0001A133CB|nr:sigma 54-interacting transcriptional regulator [Bacillus pseudomycoides]EEM06316.1 Sigma54 specific transcriptional regulator, Fis [Bacillus pseudomycoides]EEM17583.1 Sigma54 specific transcriptional regulator, Fis [Bacillus pseudomycoides DSM 12442]MED1596613.1 sigma 54-interacting transcriptional regulator [Bacillus pseudomycoides]MED4710407.1 sigma 54-interacting transcriptional regulator [Bacillus pseudomycoides]OOR54066.1 Fis family transcriptional regulator [Bacillus pseudomycoides]